MWAGLVFSAAHGELQGTQVIATGASMTDADRQSLLYQGFHNTIRKPFNVQQLAALIEESLAVLV